MKNNNKSIRQFTVVSILACLTVILGINVWNGADNESITTSSKVVEIEYVIHAKELNKDKASVNSEVRDSGESIIKNDKNDLISISVLAGTNPPDGLRVDKNGQLIVDYELRNFFDYFAQLLGVSDEYALEGKRMAIEHINSILEGEAEAQALELLSKYWTYVEQYNSSQSNPDIETAKAEFNGSYDTAAIETVEQFQKQHSEMRESIFSYEELESLFGDDIRYDNFSVLQAQGNNDLALASLSNSQVVNRQKTYLLSDYKNFINTSDSLEGLGDWRQKIEQKFGTEQAEKLALVASQKQIWEQKKADYQIRRTELMNYSGLDQMTLNNELDRIMLEELNFSKTDMRRIQALENRLNTRS